MRMDTEYPWALMELLILAKLELPILGLGGGGGVPPLGTRYLSVPWFMTGHYRHFPARRPNSPHRNTKKR